jgi:hypothetical protein
MSNSKQVPFRLTEADREKIGLIRTHFGLPSDAAAVRYAVQQTAVMIAETNQVRASKRTRSKA